jgi:5'-methylthioadenosine phosphorylase
MAETNFLFLVGVFLPPIALDGLGPVTDERTVSTTYGDVGPFALRQTPGNRGIWVLPYTGSPMRTDPRATILAALELGIERILLWDRVVALNSVLYRGDVALVADYIDWSRRLPDSLGGSGAEEMAAQMVYRPPFCEEMAAALRQSLPGLFDVTYVGVDGLRRETPAEARMFAAWGADVLGFNLVPEVQLAQEVDLAFAGLVTVHEIRADRAVVPPTGEVRASLGLTLDAMVDFFRLMNSAD